MTPFIAVEWGTARIVARLVGPDGSVLDRTIEEVRLAELDEDRRIERLEAMRRRWPHAAEPILLAGMIGSPMGLAAVSQLPCPATPDQIAAHSRTIRLRGLLLVILPGLSCASRFGDHDVLRGEEVAAAGLVSRQGAGEALLLSVPGMHGKWVELGGGRIDRFHTSMSVELFTALADRTILQPLMQSSPVDCDAFRCGVARGAQGGSLARLLFTARTAVMADRLAEQDATSYIWGLLIGADVRENIAVGEGRRSFVTGSGDVAPLFCAAINWLGVAAELIDADEAAGAGFADMGRLVSRLEHRI